MSRTRDQQKEQRLIDAALTVFGRDGFKQASVQEIAGIAGVAPGTIYTYFSDKEALFMACVQQGWNQFIEGIRRLSESSIPSEKKINWFVDFGFDILLEVQPLLRGMYSEMNKRHLFKDHVDRLCDFITKILADAELFPGVFLGQLETMRPFIVRVFVSGVLFDTAIVPPEDLKQRIAELKFQVKSVLSLRNLFSSKLPDSLP